MKDFGLSIWGDKNFIIHNDTINVNHASKPSLLQVTQDIRDKGYKGPFYSVFPILSKNRSLHFLTPLKKQNRNLTIAAVSKLFFHSK